MKRLKDKNITESDSTVEALYKIGLLLVIPAILLFIFLRTNLALDILMTDSRMCSIKRMTGLDCPGCGGTRAILYLARFRVLDSFRMNAAVPVGAILYIFFMIKQTMHKVFGTKGLKEKDIYVLITIFAVTIVLKWIVSNFA